MSVVPIKPEGRAGPAVKVREQFRGVGLCHIAELAPPGNELHDQEAALRMDHPRHREAKFGRPDSRA